MTVDMTLVDEYRTALKHVAGCDRSLTDLNRSVERQKATLENEAAQNNSNDTARKAAAKASIADDPDIGRWLLQITDLEHDKALALADAEAAKYAIRLTIATLGAGRE